MDKTIVCKFDLFDATQRIYEISDDGQKIIATVESDGIADALSGLAYNHKIGNIHLYGAEEYLNGIVENIKTNSLYSEHNLKIEVN